MLEAECHNIDVKLAAMMAIEENQLDKDDFNQYVQTQLQISNFKLAANNYDDKINMVHEAISAHIIRFPEKENEIRDNYQSRLDILTAKKDQKVIFKNQKQ